MGDRIFETAFDVQSLFTAGDNSAHRADLQQHTLKIEEIVAAEHGLAMTGEDAMQIGHGEFMSQLGQAAAAGLFGGGIDQIERHEDLAHHEILHLANAVDDAFLADREMACTAAIAGVLEDRIQENHKMARQKLGVSKYIGDGLLLISDRTRDPSGQDRVEQNQRIATPGEIQ